MHHEGFKVAVVSTLYYKSTKLERAIDRLFVEVDKAYRDGANILVLSDRGVDENHMPIPSLLAVSAVHQHLVKTKKSTSLAIILESGEPREVHHFATLLGYGASAVNPYLALETIHELIDTHMPVSYTHLEFYIKIMHVSCNLWLQSSKVVIFHFLSLRSRSTK